MENKITFGGNMSAKINFAMQQNYVPIFRSVVMTNNTEQELKNVKLRISFEPEFAKVFEAVPVDLRPSEPVEISPLNIILLSDYLFSLTEKLVGSVTIQALQDDEVIAEESRNIELLAYDQWTGVNYMPETAVAFVSPNHPKIQEIIASAGVYMKKWCGDPAFTGYQTKNPNIVKQQMGAVYAALQEQNIAYTMPPASFEESQRIRMPDAVLEGKHGTCLDLAVLYCSCLEAIGLNPLIVIIQGHAFAGCWLENETFSDCLQYDMSALTKRIAHGIDAMCLIECTDFVAGKNTDFNTAEKHAEANLDDESRFCFAIDVSRTRSSGIRPVPSRVSENGTFKSVDYGERKKSEITSAPYQINVSAQAIAGEAREVTKQVMWERKLLDLSLRNSLLNFRPTTMSVQLMISDLGLLEDEMSKGEDFKVMPMPNDMTLQMSDSKIFETENEKDIISTISESEFKSRRLRTFMQESELEKIMKKLHRQAKVSIEENGVNTTYLALGFLRWYETEKSDKPRYAPLVLVPIDIIRKVQEKSYIIRVRDEDTQFNITMLEYVRQTFGLNINGLDPLPEDENGIDLQLIFNTVRQGIMSQPRWDLVEYAFIGQFSFNRFIMWNDIRNRADELAKNKVVASLISGKTEWADDDLYISPLDLDNNVAPTDLVVPLSADSSQLAAVYAASQGRSFVLHGPPGSGKSQTITNMIASALYQGKSVLFVAEKMAALSVVEKRLDKVGLGPFCIELHSNKAQKSAVLKQLEETLNIGKIKKPAEYKAQADKISEIRKEINGTMEEIHKKRNFGCSLYDAAVRYEKNSSYGGRFSFTKEQLDSMNDTSYSSWHETLERLTAAGREFGDVTTSALGVCELTACTPETRGSFESELKELKNAVSVAQSHTAQLASFTGSDDMTFEECRLAAEIISASASGEQLFPEMISDSRWNGFREPAKAFIASGKELSQIKNELLTQFEPSVLGYNAADALVKWKTAQGKWFIPKSIGSSKLVKELAAYAKKSSVVTKENITQYYDKINQYNTLKAQTASVQLELAKYFGSVRLDENTDWSMVEKCVERSDELGEKVAASTFSPEVKSKICDSLTSGVQCDISRISSDYAALEDIASQLNSNFCINTDKLITGGNWSSNSQMKIDAVIDELPQLKEWTGIVTLCNELREYGIGNVADAYLNGEVPTDELIPAFECDISKAMITATISESKELSSFQGTIFEDTVRRFGEVIDNFSTLSIKELAAELSAKIPAPGSSANSSEIGILQKAIKSNGRMMSIRKLFDSIPNLLRRMCPVMLMSPISVAQYIDPSFPKFDLVIFDEASQLPTCEAVGAIARGENVIVVGDPKQLPPTSFFSANQTDEENYEKEDLESVLDDCLALSMCQKHLLWHYRSRHESLIAYSNSKYYENKLYTFPSPDDQVSEVSWVHVEGFYDKSSTRTNKAEAQAVVEEICRRLRDEELRKLSIGVVTFSLPQQNLIDDLLMDAYREDPKLEEYANEMYEPILIKNLENVQGDERDVIMFSVGYGPDKDGKVSMNFGPLNRDGGWRRLNVAISRSKCKMIVFSVITPDMIDLSRTRSDGVEGLKGFLEFAAKGRSALPVRAGTVNSSEGFEAVVAAEIKKMGYECRCSVGCSDYKVDVAVTDPNDKNMYILGINCGSEPCFRNGTASDRSLSQPSVLKGLGWNVMNVHIIDWLDNKEKTLGKVKDAIESALKQSSEPDTAPKEEKKAQELVFETEEQTEFNDSFDEFKPFRLKALGTSENFNTAASEKITRCINDILSAEAPMNKKTLAKKTFSCWGISRPGANMKSLFESAFEKADTKVTVAGENEYVWCASQVPEEYDICRIVYNKDEKRDIDDVAPEEIAVGIKAIMSRQIAMSRDDLLREVAHLFGFTRMTETLETSVSFGIKAAKTRGWVGFSDDGRVSYTGN